MRHKIGLYTGFQVHSAYLRSLSAKKKFSVRGQGIGGEVGGLKIDCMKNLRVLGSKVRILL